MINILAKLALKAIIVRDVWRLCLLIIDYYVTKYWPSIVGIVVAFCEVVSVYTTAETLGLSIFSFELVVLLCVIALASFYFTCKNLEKYRSNSK